MSNSEYKYKIMYELGEVTSKKMELSEDRLKELLNIPIKGRFGVIITWIRECNLEVPSWIREDEANTSLFIMGAYSAIIKKANNE